MRKKLILISLLGVGIWMPALAQKTLTPHDEVPTISREAQERLAVTLAYTAVGNQLKWLGKEYPSQAKALARVADSHKRLMELLENLHLYAPTRFYRELLNELTKLYQAVEKVSDATAQQECKRLLNHTYYYAPNGGKWITLHQAAQLVVENNYDLRKGFSPEPWDDFYQTFDGKGR